MYYPGGAVASSPGQVFVSMRLCIWPLGRWESLCDQAGGMLNPDMPGLILAGGTMACSFSPSSRLLDTLPQWYLSMTVCGWFPLGRGAASGGSRLGVQIRAPLYLSMIRAPLYLSIRRSSICGEELHQQDQMSSWVISNLLGHSREGETGIVSYAWHPGGHPMAFLGTCPRTRRCPPAVRLPEGLQLDTLYDLKVLWGLTFLPAQHRGLYFRVVLIHA